MKYGGGSVIIDDGKAREFAGRQAYAPSSWCQGASESGEEYDLEMTLDLLNNSGLSGKRVRDQGTISCHWMYELLDMAPDADVAINLETMRKMMGGLCCGLVYSRRTCTTFTNGSKPSRARRLCVEYRWNGGCGEDDSCDAKLVYNHERVVLNFPCGGWVYVSGEFSVADVLRKLLLQLGAGIEQQ
ncbi:hypothetical protein SASPL_148787 [Salvia splendens]|uniref:Uncharacterized protein n=1 Tax=Salvia splendens TaxID=180675 RepID=A0A8X8WAI1_SALSN|nr:hypothetical protein SASPL_148787 [Salvia splendens]